MTEKKNDPPRIAIEKGRLWGSPTELNSNIMEVNSNHQFLENNVTPMKDYGVSNKLDQVIRTYNLKNDDIAKALKTKTETVSKHRHGKSPITWEMAQKYQNYFIIEHNIMVDAFLLLTSKQDQSDNHVNTLDSGKIEIIGQFLQENYSIELFPKDWKKIYLQSSMYNHYIFMSAEDWGLASFIYVNRHNDSAPYNNKLDQFFAEDYHYWIVLKSPLKRNYVHRSCLGNFSICKIEDTGELVVGIVYERPKRTRQAPQKYEVVNPLFSVNGGFLSEDKDFSSVSLEYATPILSSILNIPGSGVGIIEEPDNIRRFD